MLDTLLTLAQYEAYESLATARYAIVYIVVILCLIRDTFN